MCLAGRRAFARDLDVLKAVVRAMARAIKAGIFNDLGSGSQVDLCVITKETPKSETKMETFRGYQHFAKKTHEPMRFSYEPGTTKLATPFLNAATCNLPKLSDFVITDGTPDAMEE